MINKLHICPKSVVKVERRQKGAAAALGPVGGVITAAGLPEMEKFVCNLLELEALIWLFPWHDIMTCLF